ncbi:MAG: ATP-binding protein [Chloroflexi bacterium]|nr:ATP-binding protein [Chloroflexota bacterium]
MQPQSQPQTLTNPYVAGSPLTQSAMFFGREDVFDFVRRTLVGQHQDNILVLYGQRRTGKTSVLYQMRHHLDAKYVPILIDLQGLSLDSMSGFFWELATTIQRQLRRDWQIELPRPESAAFAQNPLKQFQEGFLEQAWEALGDRHLLLMIDEALRLDEQVRAGKLDPQMFDLIRSLTQHNPRLNFIFSIGARLGQVESKEFEVLLNPALYKEISFLDRPSAEALIAKPAQGVYRVTDEAVQRIAEVTSCHAYFTQLLCHSLFSRYAGQMPVLGVQEVESVLPEVVERGTVNLKFVWDDSSLAEKVVLLIMSELAARENRAIMEEEIGIALKSHGLAAPENEVSAALRDLVAREVVSRVEGYLHKFSVDLMRLWLRQSQRIEWLQDQHGEELKAWQAQVEVAAPIAAPRRRGLVLAAAATAAAVLALSFGVVFALPRFLPGAPAGPAPEAVPTTPAVVYDIDRCETRPVPGSDGKVVTDTCVTTIQSESEGKLLRVNMKWTARATVRGLDFVIEKGDDVRNPNMVLEDSKGNAYFYVDLGGGAIGKTSFRNGTTVTGWFLFPVPVLAEPPLAVVDRDQEITVGGIELTRRRGG